MYMLSGIQCNMIMTPDTDAPTTRPRALQPREARQTHTHTHQPPAVAPGSAVRRNGTCRSKEELDFWISLGPTLGNHVRRSMCSQVTTRNFERFTQEGSLAEPDMADRASAESDQSLELRTRDRERKLVSKIDEALGRIIDGSYGYCEETDEPIGLKRLQARPIATLSIEAQERHERRERIYRDE